MNRVLKELVSRLLNGITKAQGCDARDDDSSTEAGNINIYLIFPGL